jgi:hypothetical protein
MIMIDITELFKTVTSTVANYLLFITLALLGYLMLIALVKVVGDNVVKVVLASRMPVEFKVKETVE